MEIILIVVGVVFAYLSVRYARPPIRVFGVVVGVGLVVAALSPIPLTRARKLARRTQCQSNLHSWHLALSSSSYPPAITYPEYLWNANPGDVSPELLICPRAAHEYGMPGVELTMSNIRDYCDYIYVSGLAPHQHKDLPVMICPPENHGGEGANVLYNSGSTFWVPAEEFEDLIVWTYAYAESNGLRVVLSKALADRSNGRYKLAEGTPASPVSVEGIAHNAKAGAVVECDGGAVYYCLPIDSWPDDVLGKRIRVSGKHVRDDRYKAKDDGILISQGTAGNDAFIKNAKYRLVDEASRGGGR